MKDLVGQTLNRYKILALLGEGGMGAVFKARDVTLKRDVAVKVMHPHLARQPDFRERFLREAQTAARLDHSCIVQVHDFGQEGDRLYIVMKFIAGANLDQMLRDLRAQGGWIVLDEAVRLVRQMCLALDYAHRQGVLHRDIKPGNIMIEPEPSDGLPYRPILTDLGLARLLEGQRLTQEGTSMGTPAYMSPEQALGEETDARSDVYSLGILLYELAVGRLPFPVKTISEAIRYHTKELPPPPRSIRPGLPPSLERVILKAIEKAPADRFPNAVALATALEDLLPSVTKVAIPAVAEKDVSLITEYQRSLVEPRGPSVLDEFPAAQVTQDQIQIMERDKTVRSVPIKTGKMTIGRAADNDIVLDDLKASRHHARIEFDETGCRVVDLGSSNGTFLANAKLLSGVPEGWSPQVGLRIGDTWLHQVRASQSQAVGTVLDPGRVRTSLGGQVGVVMEGTQFAVEPGGSVSFPVLLLNQGARVDHFQVTLEGVPASWVPALPPLVQLLPGGQQQVTLTIRPPRTPESRAGKHPITVCVTSQAQREVAEAPGTLTVGAYHQFSLELRPQKQSSAVTGAFRVPTRNQGNADLTLRFEALDPEESCYYLFDPPQVTLPPGEERVVQLTVQPKAKLVGEATRTYPFTVTARSIQAPEQVQRVQGVWVQTPPPPEPKRPVTPCANHPESEAVATCVSCGKRICEACAVEVRGQVHCKQCLAAGAQVAPSGKARPAEKPRFSGCMRWVLYTVSFLFWIAGLIIGILFMTQDDQESKQVGRNCLIAMVLGLLATCFVYVVWAVMVGGLMLMDLSSVPLLPLA